MESMGFVDVGESQGSSPCAHQPLEGGKLLCGSPFTLRVLAAGVAVVFSSGTLTRGFVHEGDVWGHTEQYPL